MTLVMHVITGLELGGAEQSLFRLLQAGLQGRCRNVVVSLHDRGLLGADVEALGVPVHTIGMMRGSLSPVALGRLLRVTREIGPDIIQGWMYHGNLAASLARRLGHREARLTWNIRHALHRISDKPLLTRFIIRLCRHLSKGPETVVFNSRASCRQHIEYGYRGDRNIVIPNGIDTELFHPHSEEGRSLRQTLGVPREALVVGHLARYHPLKDHATFIRAAVRVAEAKPGAHFMLAGSGVVWEETAIASLVPPTMRERFHFIGERRDVTAVLSAVDVFCLSSVSEAFPNVLCEAMAVGLPCVATNVGDSRYILDRTGLVVEPGDPVSLAESIMQLLALPATDRVALGREARSRARSFFSIRNTVRQYVELYQRLTA